ncbi:N-methyl-L-tryptophan oxidase [Paenibacillus thermotolerans]|uniref:N-methyl-L-tryptophan oxidase n=1 Tax=Paenibacillus thermotolerans TaxID=3027807 RepID=UPI0023678038|nr:MULTISPECIES: N-methyl-L-tryptophan oxidase [unclassified Paenibacillus]
MNDVIVVGAGSMGAAAGYFLASNGLNTLMLDSFRPPHSRGSHHGDTRIIRHAYGDNRNYVPFALRAQSLWENLQEQTGQTLFYRTGHLNAGSPDSAFLQEVAVSSSEFSLPIERLASTEVMKRWPGIKLPEHYVGYFETASGALKSELCVEAYLSLAISRGAKLQTDTRVHDIDIHPDGVTVRTDNGTFHAGSVVISAGAWAGRLLSSVGVNLPLTPTRKTIAWFDADERHFGSDCFPTFIFDLDDSIFYGFPSIGGAGLKVGRHDGGRPVLPDGPIRKFGSDPDDLGDLTSFLERHMPGAEKKFKHGKVCMYTMTPDQNFIIDVHPEHSHVAFAAGFSGHGFKFSSAVGEILSQLIVSGRSGMDLSIFSSLRFT